MPTSTRWIWVFFCSMTGRARPNLSVSLGLRYEIQTNISQGTNFAPRIGVAWSPRAGTSGRGKTVIRGGFGMFYDRVSEDLTLQSLRFNGLTQQQYIVRNPDFYPFVPSTDTLARSAGAADHPAAGSGCPGPLPDADGHRHRTAAAAPHDGGYHLYAHARCESAAQPQHQCTPGRGTGERPFGRDDLFQFETTGFMRQNQLIANIRTRFHSRVSLFGFYSLNKAKSDTDGVGSFPANQYDLSTEYGRSARDIRHRFGMGGSITGPGGLRFSPFIIVRSGVPFNITTGGDNNADLMFTDRPALATDLNDPNVIATRFGVFDPTPEPGTPVIARNFGEGPSYSAINFSHQQDVRLGKENGRLDGRFRRSQTWRRDHDRRPSAPPPRRSQRTRRALLRRRQFRAPLQSYVFPLRSEPFQHNQPGRADRKLNLTAVWTIQRLSRLWTG